MSVDLKPVQTSLGGAHLAHRQETESGFFSRLQCSLIGPSPKIGSSRQQDLLTGVGLLVAYGYYILRSRSQQKQVCLPGEISTMSSPKVVVIGLDSADRNLVSRWCDSGDLPVLRSIRDRGISGVLTTPQGLGDDAVWASFYTAVSPGRHGRYYHRQLRPGSYAMDNFRDVRREPFWDAL